MVNARLFNDKLCKVYVQKKKVNKIDKNCKNKFKMNLTTRNICIAIKYF